MNYANIFYDDTVNGDGYRTSLFVSGCGKTPKCKNCWSPQAWDFNYGKEFTVVQHNDIINSMKKEYIHGLSILGGEPMDNLDGGQLLILVKDIKECFPNKTIYCWSGYTYEELIKRQECLNFLQYVDMLRDGEFIFELKDITQYLEGSTNQRCIDVQESLKQNKTIIYKK